MEMKELLEFIEDQHVRINNHFKDHPNHDLEKKRLARTVKLNEEVGELCSEILSHTSFQRQKKLDKSTLDTLKEEFADVIFTTLLLARSMDVDIVDALKLKIKKIKKRKY